MDSITGITFLRAADVACTMCCKGSVCNRGPRDAWALRTPWHLLFSFRKEAQQLPHHDVNHLEVLDLPVVCGC